MGLVAAREQPRLVPLRGGVSSLIVRVQAAFGTACVKCALPKLKVAADWSAPVERSLAEVAWLRTAAAIVPGAVPDIVGVDETGKAFAMAYLEAASHPVWKERLRDGYAGKATAAAVAARLVAIHNATAQRNGMAAAFANDATFHAIRLDPYLGEAGRVHADCRARLQALMERTRNTKLALMHGDVSPKNILVGPAGPVFLDAECACYGDPAFDVAFCLNHLLLKCVWRPAHVLGYLACFQAFSTTYLRAVRWEAPARLESRCADLLPALLLARVDGKSPVEYLSGARERSLVRQFAKRLLLSPPARLDAVAAQWRRALSA